MVCKKPGMPIWSSVHLAEPKNWVIFGFYSNRHVLNFNWLRKITKIDLHTHTITGIYMLQFLNFTQNKP